MAVDAIEWASMNVKRVVYFRATVNSSHSTQCCIKLPSLPLKLDIFESRAGLASTPSGGEQDERRDGRPLPVQARVHPGVQGRDRAAHQQRRPRRLRAQPHERLGLCRDQRIRQRSGRSTGNAPDSQPGRHGRGCRSRLLAPRRDRARPLCGIGYYHHRRRPRGATLRSFPPSTPPGQVSLCSPLSTVL